MPDYIKILKAFMHEKELQDLSSFGWSRMKQAQRDLESGKIIKEDFVAEFLKERDFAKTIGRDKAAMDELQKMIK